MNRIQEAIAAVTGLDVVIDQNDGLRGAIEEVSTQNAFLQRQIDDIDYLNMFDLNHIQEVIPLGDRKKYYNRLRRLRQENPLAKQSVKLITRFTLGRGIQISIGPDPEKPPPSPAAVPIPDPAGDGGAKLNGLFPGPRVNSSRSTAGLPPPPKRARPQVGEAVALDDEDQLKEIIESFWKDNDNQMALTSHESMKEWLDGNVTDGEKFLACFIADTEPYLRLTEIPVEEITNIIYDPDNWRVPIYYRRAFQSTKFSGESEMYEPDGNPQILYYLDYRVTTEKLALIGNRINIPASKKAPDDVRIFHSMINPIWTKAGKRGVSELFASREWFRVYKEFMEDRAAINAAATAIAYKRKIKAGPTGVAQFQGKFGGVDVGYDNPNNTTEISRLTRPTAASTYDSNPAVDLDWMKTDTGAINAKEDARSLLMAAGAGVGMFVHYFGEGGDANLATAQAMELPMVKTFEDWQEWVNSNLRALCQYVITIATDEENAKKQIDRVSGSFPPLISQDVVKYTTAWSQVVQNIAAGNRVVHSEAIRGALTVMGTPNVDALMTQIEAEETQLEVERQAQKAAMLDAMKNPIVPPPPGVPRNGSDQGLPPDVAASVNGKTPARNGPKPE